MDKTTAKRALVIGGAVAVAAGALGDASLLPGFYTMSFLQAVTGIAVSTFNPALAAITLGIVGPRLFSSTDWTNESFRHAGTVATAAAAGGLAYFFGPVVVFWLLAVMAVISVAATLRVPHDAIDHDVARGMDRSTGEQHTQPSGFAVLLHDRRLMIFAVVVVIFHFANAAMLPLVGQELALHNKEVWDGADVGVHRRRASRHGAGGVPGRRQSRHLGTQADISGWVRRLDRSRVPVPAVG